jgi:hypothetical protein
LPPVLDLWELLVTFVEVLSHASRVESPSSLGTVAETCGAETLRVGVHPGAGDGVAGCDVRRGQPGLAGHYGFGAKYFGHAAGDSLDGVGVQTDLGISVVKGIDCHLDL